MPSTMPTRPHEGQRPQASDEEAWLARRAAAGDGSAFTTLYDRYERRAYNLCYRITGSRDDAADATQETFVNVLERLPHLTGRELQFGPYLLRAARYASYDAIARRRRAAPAAEIPESAVPVASADSDLERPERGALLEAHQEQIRAANRALAPRQREALALRELEELSYDEIAEIMGMNRNSVAQLLSRARIALRDGLRRTALGSIASASPDCERALPLLALRQDGALEHDAASADWLARHLSACAVCPARVAAMDEAGVAYRLWLPLVPALWLRGEAIANAAERVGADWSEFASPGGAGAPRVRRGASAASRAGFRRGRRRGACGAAVVLVLLAAALFAADAAKAPETPALVAAHERGETPGLVSAHERGRSAALPSPGAVTHDASETADLRRPVATPRARDIPDASDRGRQRARSHGNRSRGSREESPPSPAHGDPTPSALPNAEQADLPPDPAQVVDPPRPSEPDDDPVVGAPTCDPAPASPPVRARPRCPEGPCPADGASTPLPVRGGARLPCSDRPCRPAGSAPPASACPEPPCDRSPQPASSCPGPPAGPGAALPRRPLPLDSAVR